jgi:hypothetical protein
MYAGRHYKQEMERSAEMVQYVLFKVSKPIGTPGDRAELLKQQIPVLGPSVLSTDLSLLALPHLFDHTQLAGAAQMSCLDAPVVNEAANEAGGNLDEEISIEASEEAVTLLVETYPHSDQHPLQPNTNLQRCDRLQLRSRL